MVRLMVNHATTVLVTMVCVVLFGLQSYVDLPREAAPDIEIPVVIVSTPYIGVAPADVEGLITIPIERELASVPDVKKMSSSSAEGVSVVSLEFEPEVDIDEAIQKVRDRVDRARPKLPSDAEDPSVSEVSFSDIPILLLTLAGPVDEQVLKVLGEDIADEATRIQGVLNATVSGGRERQIRVEIIPERLAHYGLSLDNVVTAIQGENVNIPGGNITSGRATFLLRVPGEFRSAREIEGVAVKRVGDIPVFVRDLGRVVDGFEDRATYSRMNGQPSVTVSVTKRAGSNMLAVSEAVKVLAAERSASWPADVSWRVLGDQSENVEDMVAELQNNIITALILVVGVILIFMGARSSLFVAVAIPLSMLGSFILVAAFGFTLNMVVLFSLILALGMLVDNAIVVVENIFRHMEEGKSPVEASVDGTNEVAVAVAASTATTVAAFLPMIFWTGIMGQFMGFLPKTVIIVLVSSLAVAVMILPVLTSRLLKVEPRTGPAPDPDRAIDPAKLGRMMNGYLRVLTYSIRHRYMSLGIGVATLVGTLMIYGQLQHGVEFFPATDPDRAVISVRLPEGADLEATDRVVRAVEAILVAVENIDVFVAESGVNASGNALAGKSNVGNAARITVDFLPPADKADRGEKLRVEGTWLTIVKLRAAFAEIPGAKISMEPEQMGPPVGAPIAVEVSGDDFDHVGEVARAVQRGMAAIEGTTDLENDYRVGRPEMRLRIDRGAAKRVGVSTRSIGNAVRTAIAGTKASALRAGEDEIDIVVQVAPEFRSDLQQVLSLRIPGREDTSPKTFPVPLSSVAGYELAGGSGTIKHIDQDLVVTITGDVTRPELENEVRKQVGEFIEAYPAPDGVFLRLGGANDEQRAAQAFLMWAFALAVALIVLVLVTQFDSLATPLIIVFTVLLSLVGVLWGLLITGTPFGVIMTGIGVISLAGVVVNNAIVLLDYVEQLRARGLSMQDALLRAGVTRFRPVMLTAITTTLGLVPMAVGLSIDFAEMSLVLGSSSAQFWGPMAVAVIFGLSFATVLTLVMVPTLYSILEDLRLLAARLTPGGSGAAAAASGAAVVVMAFLWAAPAHAATLDEVWEHAEQHNIDLALAHEASVQAGTLKWQAISAVGPKLSLAADYALVEDPVLFDLSSMVPESLAGFLGDTESEPIVVQPKQKWTGSATLLQPLFNGASLPGYKAARSMGRAALLDEERARQRVRGAVARVYYGLATSRTAIEVSEASLATARHQLDLAGRQRAAGLADRRVVLQGELGVARAERDLLGARERLVSASEAFARVTGLPGTTAVELPDRVDLPPSVEAALADARRARPDLGALDERIDSIRRQRTAHLFGWAPSVDGIFNVLYDQSPSFASPDTIDDLRWQWRLGVQFKWNLWDGGLRLAKGKEYSSQVRVQELRKQQTEQLAAEEVRTTWVRVERAEQALASVTAELALAEENLALAELAFGAGSVTWLDVELARVSLEATRLAGATERMNRDLAAIDLLVATGTLTSGP